MPWCACLRIQIPVNTLTKGAPCLLGYAIITGQFIPIPMRSIWTIFKKWIVQVNMQQIIEIIV
ncbi:MAG: hypothetical protein BGO55_03830 [Sphingobacteriales bacterium 50-39]|nr:MAG: hypothetical protein BGO55_03830 [Sphingobacteriales bacterium 50-39]